MIKYVDSDFLRSSEGKFVLKVESLLKINKTLEEFADKFQLDGITNGKLFVVSKFNKYEFNCDYIIDNYLSVNELTRDVDYVLLYMPLTARGQLEVDDQVGKELLDTIELDWIQSLLFVNEYIYWLVDDEKTNTELINKILKHNYELIEMPSFKTPIVLKVDKYYIYFKYLNEDITHKCFIN
jgi:hypothetical protein